MDNKELSDAQREYLNNQLAAGVAFEEFSRTRGFELIKSYYEDQLKIFVNAMMNREDEPISNFENDRQRLIGLKKLFGRVNDSMQVLQDERTKAKPTS